MAFQQSHASADFERLVDEFVARLRNGEQPSTQEYFTLYPEHSAQLRKYLPIVMWLEHTAKQLLGDGSAGPDEMI